MKTVIYGSSDDLIEVEGDQFYDEFNTYDETAIQLSTGHVFFIRYTDEGFWKITPTFDRPMTDEFSWTIAEATDIDGDYSDVLTIEADIDWLTVGRQANRKATS